MVAYTKEGRPVTAADMRVVGALGALLRDALEPNLVQTRGRARPALGARSGPFGNIAHGDVQHHLDPPRALQSADYAVVEAGFGSDLGAEKFVDIVTRVAGVGVDAAVIVATLEGAGGTTEERRASSAPRVVELAQTRRP